MRKMTYYFVLFSTIFFTTLSVAKSNTSKIKAEVDSLIILGESLRNDWRSGVNPTVVIRS